MKVILAKARRNRADIANLEAVIADETPPFSRDDLGVLRLAIEIAALHARTAGVSIDDIVGPDLGHSDRYRWDSEHASTHRTGSGSWSGRVSANHVLSPLSVNSLATGPVPPPASANVSR